MFSPREIFNIDSDTSFERVALDVFRYQFHGNEIYRNWCKAIGRSMNDVRRLEDIPFLPIEFFKTHQVISDPVHPQTQVFKSSGTTGSVTSTHYVNEVELYRMSALKGFRKAYGDPSDLVFICLLPGYLERGDSSLVYMFEYLMQCSSQEENGFFLHQEEELIKRLERVKHSGRHTLLLGVSYALLDLCGKIDLNERFIVMETGGMKGKRKEMTKPELHETLKKGLKVQQIHSEYGMTELLSQAYSQGDGCYHPPPWMRFSVRDVNDPFEHLGYHKTGGLNVIDLANLHSCSFIATKDLARLTEKGMEWMGRYDESDIRGCNLLLD